MGRDRFKLSGGGSQVCVCADCTVLALLSAQGVLACPIPPFQWLRAQQAAQASTMICFQRFSGILIRFLLITVCPISHSSSCTALYMVPDNRFQSPVIMAWRTSYNVGSFSEAISTCFGTNAAGTASLATLCAKSSVSFVLSSWVWPTERQLRTSAALSFPLM